MDTTKMNVTHLRTTIRIREEVIIRETLFSEVTETGRLAAVVRLYPNKIQNLSKIIAEMVGNPWIATIEGAVVDTPTREVQEEM